MWIIQKNPMLKLYGIYNLNQSPPYKKSQVSRSFTQVRIFPEYISRNPCVVRTALEVFGWWSASQRKRFLIVLDGGQVEKRVFTRFLTEIMAFPLFFLPSLPINRFHFLTISHTLFSSSFYNDVFPSLASHRKRPLWKSIRGYMIGQQGRGQPGCEVGLSGYHIDHHGLLFPRGPCASANIVFFFPPSSFLPLLWSHWYNSPLPLRNSLGSYVISLNSFNIIVMYY